MGLSASSTGIKAVDMGFTVKKLHDDDRVIALAGNPNVGKSSVFNQLTGLRQHTGNWPGKTVSNAQGVCTNGGKNYVLVDIPGTYSLMAHSREEEVARDFILFGEPDAVIVVCDATCLERNLNLVLQTIEITPNVVVCVNLMDEARKRGISVNLKKLSEKLGVPVVGTVAKSGRGLRQLMDSTEKVLKISSDVYTVRYLKPIEDALSQLIPVIESKVKKLNQRWVALRLLEQDEELVSQLGKYTGFDILADEEIHNALTEAKNILLEGGITPDKLSDKIVSCIVLAAEDISNGIVVSENSKYRDFDRCADKILTGRLFGIPIMILLLALVFWITISGANIPSGILSGWFAALEEKLLELSRHYGIPEIIYSPLILGVYHVLTWVIAVMLPPMAVFFPLFTLLEDLGYLPRIAFNLDKCFKKCSACGKQALTMCMGFGCNAAGIVGCRIIDSPRERLIAILTNCFVPCNGKFPTLISIITMFFVFSSGFLESVISAIILTAVVLLGILMTFLISKLLSRTLLKGQPSSFTLELPPYRRPDIGKILIRSVLDRTLFVLSRAACVAAPAGLIIWLFANVYIDGATLLSICANFLDPFARLLGMDGVILFAFILGFPANEIVLPLIIMAYMSAGTISDALTLAEMKELFIQNGWTFVTAINVMLFSLLHWPCSTTMLTIKKETGSLKWTLLAFIIPTAVGLITCFLFTQTMRLIF